MEIINFGSVPCMLVIVEAIFFFSLRVKLALKGNQGLAKAPKVSRELMELRDLQGTRAPREKMGVKEQ